MIPSECEQIAHITKTIQEDFKTDKATTQISGYPAHFQAGLQCHTEE